MMLSRLLDPSYQCASAAPTGYTPATLGRQQRPLSVVFSIAGGETGDVHSAFCIVRVGDQIRETRLLCDVFSGSADLEFDDVLTL